MKKSIVKQARADEALLELGKTLGQSLAFGTVAGRCSAAQAAALQQARGEKVHRRFGLTWNQFCPEHLRMSGTQADEIIRLLHEFGPEYFENTESVRISADTYRLVAPFIRDKALCAEGETLELNSANVLKVASTVRESQHALPPPAAPAPDALAVVPPLLDRLEALHQRGMAIAAEFREMARDCRVADHRPTYESMFRSTLIMVSAELERVSREDGVA